MKEITVCFLIFLLGAAHGKFKQYVFEFGKDVGLPLYKNEIQIPEFKPLTEMRIPIPDDYIIIYVKVTVLASAPPQVNYNHENRTVTIMYNELDDTLSKYRLQVTGLFPPPI